MPSEDQRVGLKHPGLMLKYSTFKNLATMAASQDDLEKAMEFYLEVNTPFLRLILNIFVHVAALLNILIDVNSSDKYMLLLFPFRLSCWTQLM